MRCLNVLTGETGELIRDGEWIFESATLTPDYVLLPSYFNAHTHIGDSVFEAPKIELEKLVGPNGLKFKVLRESKEDEIVKKMKQSIKIIERSSATSIEFREGGLSGYKLYQKADVNKRLIALSRPENEEEAEILIDISWGFGFSSVRDHDFAFLEMCRELAMKRNKIFAIHAGERDDEDVEAALSLEPDFLIHMNQASLSNLKRAMDLEIPIVTCFRSNAFFGLFNLKNYEILSDYDRWYLGTDNAMIATPSMIDEVKFSAYFLDEEKIFRAATRNPFFKSFTVAKMDKINLRNPIASIVRRLESCDVVKIIREDIRNLE
uniref:Amidohydrolase n=1 Tax=Geoglobus ahangari TaxID=113653 RepID=A0A7C3UHZ5_9EURY